MLLVIASGNPLRGDAGVGWAIAERVEAAAPCATVLMRHELAPEMAELVSEASTVVFVDARCGRQPGRVRCVRLARQGHCGGAGRIETPAALLALADNLFAHEPDAFLVSVDVADGDRGDELSEEAAAAVPVASAMITRLLGLTREAERLRRRIADARRLVLQ